ncbi:MAG: hypothetical protein CME66_12085 [Halobacteriovoraceae bacterium]|nr:hypothetical protein [Halobacteriovoraceae bacterium]|tara:strand:+ start:128 stop:352 length:225 start_codon:yes stop_codon:yes gene_type:complete
MNGQGRKDLSNADKFLMAGNLASIVGVALVSVGSLLRMIQKEELPDTTVFNSQVSTASSEVRNLYSGRRSFFSD